LVRSCVLLVALHCLALLACGSEAVETPAAGAVTANGAIESPLRLDLSERTLVYPVDASMLGSTPPKFVQVEIERVINPRLVRIVFELSYRAEAGAETLLGSFGLFPPDKAGTYIVATRGLVHDGGAVVLSMNPLDAVDSGDRVQVDLKAITFRAN
jgi:hypothetical protein